MHACIAESCRHPIRKQSSQQFCAIFPVYHDGAAYLVWRIWRKRGVTVNDSEGARSCTLLAKHERQLSKREAGAWATMLAASSLSYSLAMPGE